LKKKLYASELDLIVGGKDLELGKKDLKLLKVN